MAFESVGQFWSSVNLTGNQTNARGADLYNPFWSSVNLTGNQTATFPLAADVAFWSSVNLTGNQTVTANKLVRLLFWSSVNLTGNQTERGARDQLRAFLGRRQSVAGNKAPLIRWRGDGIMLE